MRVEGVKRVSVAAEGRLEAVGDGTTAQRRLSSTSRSMRQSRSATHSPMPGYSRVS
jgi:hypothetical protein